METEITTIYNEINSADVCQCVKDDSRVVRRISRIFDAEFNTFHIVPGVLESGLEIGDCCFTKPGASTDRADDIPCGERAAVVLFAPAEFDGLGACADHYLRHQARS